MVEDKDKKETKIQVFSNKDIGFLLVSIEDKRKDTRTLVQSLKASDTQVQASPDTQFVVVTGYAVHIINRIRSKTLSTGYAARLCQPDTQP
ncbi:hypothetical protein Tco_0193436 [Tanacetum coccineum]